MHVERALITGASSGIGEALAHLLAKKGVKLILSGRNVARLEEIAQKVHAERIIAVDLQDKEQRKQLFAAIHETIPDLVINNAGFGIYGDVLSIPIADQLAILEVNAAAALEITLEAARTLVKSGKKGVIVNVSSVAGEHPCPGMSVYGAAKSFLTQVSQAFNTELEKKGVHVLVTCPGMVATQFAKRAARKPVKIKGKPVLSPQFVARAIWKQIEEKKGKQIVNWQYRLSSLLANLIPRKIVKKIIWNQIKKRL